MVERFKNFFRKKETVTEGKVLDVKIERKEELTPYSFSRYNMSLGMVSLDRIPHTVERRYYVIKTHRGNETFSGNYNVGRGDDVIITETSQHGSTNTRIEKKN